MEDEKTLFTLLYIRQLADRAKKYGIRPISNAETPDGRFPVWYDNRQLLSSETETVLGGDGEEIQMTSLSYPLVGETVIGSDGKISSGGNADLLWPDLMGSPEVEIIREISEDKYENEVQMTTTCIIRWTFSSFRLEIHENGTYHLYDTAEDEK